jgi:hypothetical protein
MDEDDDIIAVTSTTGGEKYLESCTPEVFSSFLSDVDDYTTLTATTSGGVDLLPLEDFDNVSLDPDGSSAVAMCLDYGFLSLTNDPVVVKEQSMTEA